MRQRATKVRRAATVATGVAMATSLGLAGAGTASAARAGATSAASPTVACTHLHGSSVTDTAKLKGCPLTSTGGTGAIANFVPSGGNVTWANGSTTDYTSTFTNPTTGCPNGNTPFKILGSVTASTNASISVGAVVKMKVCLNLSTGVVTNAAGTTIKF